MGLTALTTSILMILLGQANAWYANQPEDNIVKDMKRKLKIAMLLMIPNAATLGSALMIALTVISTDDPIRSWNAMVLGIGLMISIGSFCAYWACSFRPLPFCSIQTRGMKLHFFKIYQKIGVTGILRGTGKNVGWENQTWLYPDLPLKTKEVYLDPWKDSFDPNFPQNPSVTNEKVYKEYCSVYQKTSRSAKSEYYEKKFDKYAGNVKETWRILRAAIGHNKKGGASFPNYFYETTSPKGSVTQPGGGPGVGGDGGGAAAHLPSPPPPEPSAQNKVR